MLVYSYRPESFISQVFQTFQTSPKVATEVAKVTDSIQLLCLLVRHESAEVRSAAASRFWKVLDVEGFAAQKEQLEVETDVGVLRKLVGNLGFARVEEAGHLFKRYLTHEDWMVREGCVRALTYIRSPLTESEMRPLLEDICYVASSTKEHINQLNLAYPNQDPSREE